MITVTIQQPCSTLFKKKQKNYQICINRMTNHYYLSSNSDNHEKATMKMLTYMKMISTF